MDSIEALYFLIKLPYHIIHTLTFGKYTEKEGEETTYKTLGIISYIFLLLGIVIFLLYQLSIIIK